MSAEVLRQAAALMRERAEDVVLASGDEAWKFANIAWNDNRGTVYAVGAGPVNVADAMTEEQAEHIASWHPAVALAVADWLEHEADAQRFDMEASLSASEAASGAGVHALAVATAYLGGAQ